MARSTQSDFDSKAREAAEAKWSTVRGDFPKHRSKKGNLHDKPRRPSNPEVAKKLGVDRARVSDLLTHAIASGLVSVHVEYRYPPRGRAEIDAVKSSELNEAITAASEPNVKPPVLYVVGTPERSEDERELHAAVGNAAANFVGNAINPKDRLVVSAGRTTTAFVENLVLHHPAALADTRKLYSVTGGSASANGQIPGVSLDADSVVAMAARRLLETRPNLGGEFVTRRTLLPAAAPTADARRNLITTFAKFLDNWDKDRRPQWVVAGIGLISDRHALHVGRNPYVVGHEKTENEPARQGLADLRRRLHSRKHLIGEVAHQLFICDRTGQAFTRETLRSINRSVPKILDEINDRMVSPGTQNLAHAENLVLLAATYSKAPLVRYLATQRQAFGPTHIFVDHQIYSTLKRELQ